PQFRRGTRAPGAAYPPLRRTVQGPVVGAHELPAGQPDGGAREIGEHGGLHTRLAACPLTGDGGPVVVLKGRGDQFAAAAGLAVDQHHQRQAEATLRLGVLILARLLVSSLSRRALAVAPVHTGPTERLHSEPLLAPPQAT